ncbi:glucose repressible protein Grg1 [Fusarium oxysporum f. sp. albedinis]|nr:glucose repressible protein Grg1 [Fusarium oxysporum f. sp. albedinis]KAK2468734.1 hypothetical protein H9L39_19661 [Fusarium oxysporum f. sp. albedinis]
MDSIKQGVNYISEQAQKVASGTSKEANKEVAKDQNSSIGTRASAAKDAVSDKIDESKHDGKAEAHKQAI